MTRPILVRGARQLLTLRGPSGPRRGAALRDLGIIPDGAVLISGGLIADVGPSRRVENLAAAQAALEIDASGRVVMPAFVDSHTHLISPPRLGDYEMQLQGATEEDLGAAGGGFQAARRKVQSTAGRTLEHAALRLLTEMAGHGTTTVEAKAGLALDEAGDLRLLRITQAIDRRPIDVVPTYLGAPSIPEQFGLNAGGYIEWLCRDLLPSIGKRGLARFADLGSCGGEHARQYLAAARSVGLVPKLHAGSPDAIRLALEAGAASADTAGSVAGADVSLFARSQTIATLLPAAVLSPGATGSPDARTLIEHGAAVALATGFNHESSVFSMQMVVSLACRFLRMTPAEAITAATINGAYALALGARIGSIEYLKDADLLVLNVSDFRELPYYAGANLVAVTIKRGEIVYRQSGLGNG